MNALAFQENLIKKIDALWGVSLDKEKFLTEIRNDCIENNLSEEETEDMLFIASKTFWGFGILDSLISDQDVSDIRLIDENNIRIKRLGKRLATDICFSDKEEYINYIQKITSRNKTTMSLINATQVFTDDTTCETDILRFQLDSALVNANELPNLLIRKVPKVKKDFKRLIKDGFLTQAQYEYIRNRWKEGHGVLIVGPNGSGKTTFFNALLEETPHDKSAVVIQESKELYCDTHPEMLFKVIVSPKGESAISYSLADLAKSALMGSYDIFAIGEVKGAEAFDLGYATYTGSQCITSTHGESAIDGMDRIIDYALLGDRGRDRKHFARQFKSLDTLVFIKDYKLIEIQEVTGFETKNGRFQFSEVTFHDTNDDN